MAYSSRDALALGVGRLRHLRFLVETENTIFSGTSLLLSLRRVKNSYPLFPLPSFVTGTFSVLAEGLKSLYLLIDS